MRKTVQPIAFEAAHASRGGGTLDQLRRIVGTLIEALKRRDRAELNLQLCARIPVHTISRASGMEGDRSHSNFVAPC